MKVDKSIEREGEVYWWIDNLNSKTKEMSEEMADLQVWRNAREDACPCK